MNVLSIPSQLNKYNLWYYRLPRRVNFSLYTSPQDEVVMFLIKDVIQPEDYNAAQHTVPKFGVTSP
jgi:hypothetical protein